MINDQWGPREPGVNKQTNKAHLCRRKSWHQWLPDKSRCGIHTHSIPPGWFCCWGGTRSREQRLKRTWSSPPDKLERDRETQRGLSFILWFDSNKQSDESSLRVGGVSSTVPRRSLQHFKAIKHCLLFLLITLTHHRPDKRNQSEIETMAEHWKKCGSKSTNINFLQLKLKIKSRLIISAWDLDSFYCPWKQQLTKKL